MLDNVNKDYFILPLNIGTIYVDGNYAYFTRFPDKEIVVTKKNTQKLEKKHLSLRTWCARLVRKAKLAPQLKLAKQ